MSSVFVPGFMADQTLWDDLVPRLDTREEVVFADLKTGHTIEAIAQAILDRAPNEFHLVGFSMGGYVSREMARQAPHRVRSLVLIATSARGDTPEQIRRKESALQQISTARFSGLSLASVKASLHRERAGDAQLIERVRRMGLALGQEVFKRQSAVPRTGDLSRLGEIRCPTLVVAADDDQIRSLDEGHELRDGIPGAELVVIPRSGHMVPMEAPNLLARLMSDWWGRQVPA